MFVAWKKRNCLTNLPFCFALLDLKAFYLTYHVVWSSFRKLAVNSVWGFPLWLALSTDSIDCVKTQDFKIWNPQVWVLWIFNVMLTEKLNTEECFVVQRHCSCERSLIVTFHRTAVNEKWYKNTRAETKTVKDAVLCLIVWIKQIASQLQVTV